MYNWITSLYNIVSQPYLNTTLKHEKKIKQADFISSWYLIISSNL